MVFNHDVDDCIEAFKELSNQMWHERHMNAFIHVKKSLYACAFFHQGARYASMRTHFFTIDEAHENNE
jgi:hypothetical protein